MSDLFGLQRESKISHSGVRNIFTPHQPIQSVSLLFGRQAEFQKLIEHINTPGQHSLLYGDRGVGKSSLANVAVQVLIADFLKARSSVKRCDSSDTFETVLHDPLVEAGVDPDLKEQSNTLTEGGDAGLKAVVLSAGVKTERRKVTTYKGAQYSPSKVAHALKALKAVLLVDELDAVSDVEKQNRPRLSNC